MVLILALLFLGLGLLVLEAHLPTYGLLGTAGIGVLAGAIALAGALRRARLAADALSAPHVEA